tara:strand:+ start:7549 stop:7929 length:381 start_codon:yes stop_codon:yes gene_type:complete
MPTDHGRNVKVSQNIAIKDQECLVDPGILSSEANSPGSVQRLRLNGIVESHSGASGIRVGGCKRLWPETQRKDHPTHAMGREMGNHMFDHRPVNNWQHLFGRMSGQWTQACAEPTDENDGLHGPAN